MPIILKQLLVIQLLRNTLEEALTNKNKNYVGFTINLRIL